MLRITLAIFAVLFALTWWRYSPPSAAGLDAPADRFSATRARSVQEKLVGDGATRFVGTEGNRRGREAMMAELTKAGWTVETQEATTCTIYGLCVPVVNKNGKCIGVTQALNKRGGPFTAEDEARLKAFTAQVSIALENAKLFDDVQNMRNYNQSVLESMSSAVITLGEDGRIHTCNAAGFRIFKVREADVIGKPAGEFLTGPNAWILDRLKALDTSGAKSEAMNDNSVVS